MSFESSFPDEIILDICRYLCPIDILLAFGGLNYRLNRTISDFIHHVRLSSIISCENYLYLLRKILPSIWSSIQSLTIDNSQVPCLSTLFLDHTKRILPLNLRRLCLFHLNINEIYNFITRLMDQSLVEELVIECVDTDYTNQQELYRHKIAQMLFYRHPTLKSIELSGEIIFDLSHLSFLSLSTSEDINLTSFTNTSHLSLLRRLTIPLQSLSSLHLILIYQPYLEYLNIHIGDAKSINDYSITPFPPLLNLREFHFRSEDLAIKFENLAELLRYFPNLKSLSLDLTTECRALFDGDLLRTLVQSLDVFQFSLARFFRPTSEEQTLSTFYTPFWLEQKKWFVQCYWHIDEEHLDSDYFHIYSIPYLFSHFDVYKCTNENLISKDKFKPFFSVKRLDISETSDANIIPFLKSCPNVQTICLNDIYDDEENYGTDEEDNEDLEEQIDDNISNVELELNTSHSSLPILFCVRYLTLVALSEHGLDFFERLIRVTPNLNRLSIFFDDLLEIIYTPQHQLCQLLQKHIDQLELHLDYSWSIAEIRRGIPKIFRIFSNTKSLKLFFHSDQRRSLLTVKEILINVLKYQTNLICINIDGSLSTGFESIIKQGGNELIKTWLNTLDDRRFKSNDDLKNSIHIELNSFSVIVWL